MDLALKDIRRHLGKFLATILGVAMLLAIVLVMNGIYRGNIVDGIWLIDEIGADLWVVERGRGGPFNEPSRLALDTYRSVAATPGVAQASPLLLYTAQRFLAGRERQFTVIGYDVFGGLGGPSQIVQGRGIEAPRYEMVADRKLGLALGDSVTVGRDTFTVVGLLEGAVDSSGSPLMYLSIPDAQSVQYEQDNRAIEASRAASLKRLQEAGYSAAQSERLLPLLSSGTTINAVLVRLQPYADPQTVRTQISDWLYLNVYTTQEERDLMLEGKLKRMSSVLGLFRALLIMVSIVIIGLIIYVLTIEKIKSIATLKLIGAPNSLIVRLILTQSLLLTIVSFVVAYGLRGLIAQGFARNLAFTVEETAITFVVMLIGGLIASFLAIWHALRTPPQLALGG